MTAALVGADQICCASGDEEDTICAARSMDLRPCFVAVAALPCPIGRDLSPVAGKVLKWYGKAQKF